MVSRGLPEQWVLGVGSAAIRTTKRCLYCAGGHIPRVLGGCLRGLVLQPRDAMLRAESTGTLQNQPHGWSSSPKPLGLIFSRQLTQRQKRPANASSLLVQLSGLQDAIQPQRTGPGCQEPGSPDTRLSPRRSSKAASPSFGILEGPRPLQHQARVGHRRGSQGIPPLSSVLQAQGLALGLRALALFIHRPGVHGPGPFGPSSGPPTAL